MSDDSREPSVISVMKEESRRGKVRVLIHVVQAVGVEGRGPADDSVDLVSLLEKEFGEV